VPACRQQVVSTVAIQIREADRELTGRMIETARNSLEIGWVIEPVKRLDLLDRNPTRLISGDVDGGCDTEADLNPDRLRGGDAGEQGTGDTKRAGHPAGHGVRAVGARALTANRRSVTVG